MRARGSPDVVAEHIEAGPGRREIPLPVKATYSLSELLPRRPDAPGYRLPGEVGAPLSMAFERTLALLLGGHGPLAVQAPSKILTPRWHRLVNRLVQHGLARTVNLSLPLERGLPLYYFDIGSPFLGHRTDGGRPQVTRYSRGFSDDYDHALSKVAGECLERGPLLYFKMADFVRGSARSLRSHGMRILEPKTLSVFSPSQIERRPELRFDDDSVFHWTRCTSLLTSEEAFVPAQLVYWNYPVGWGDVPEPVLREQNTHGAGGFYSLEGAILSGLLECLQRDGFFWHWLRRVAPARIATEGVSRPSTVRLLGLARDVGLEPLLFDITSELGIPTCLCALVRSDDEIPHVTMGASCRLDGETAIHDALLEAASVHHLIAQETERLRLPTGFVPFADPTFDTRRRLAFWANPEHAHHLAFFLGGPRATVRAFCRGLQPAADARASLALVLDVLRQRGIGAWYVEARHEALDELGYASARVIVPDLLPMYCEDRNAPLGHVRLQAGPEPPPWPHPFP
jgi:ribosomal protein S12 methylthiotransferase accessory factor